MERNERNVAANIWTARVIPIILAGVVGYATYVLVVQLCVDYLLKKHHDKSAAISILVIYFVLFLLMSSSFFRLVYVTTFMPPYVELGPRAVRDKKKRTKESIMRSKEDGIGGAEYDAGTTSGETTVDVVGSSNDPDSPGLELFYTKDVFVCEMDGKPRWCSECMNWKPDRTHHCSSSGRCIRKMDHFCPWVGGPVGENNFKFFVQFTGYTALYTLHLLIVMSFYTWKQSNAEGEEFNRQFAAIIALAGFFFLFTAGMTGTSFELIFRNLTQVERLGIRTRVHTLAVLQPPREQLFQINPTLASHPEYYEITYPLGTGRAPLEHQGQVPEGRPLAKSYMHARRPIFSQDAHIERRLSEVSQIPVIPVSDLTDGDSNPSEQALVAGSGATTPDGLGLAVEAQQVAKRSEVARTSMRHSQREQLSDRDLQATRTFAILTVLKPGDNPWHLGSAIENWKSVMGYTILDSLLPIKLSPCCNHEDPESHFMIGPAVHRLRSSVGFTNPADVPNIGPRTRERDGYPKPKTEKEKLHAKRPISEQLNRQTNERVAHDNISTEMRHLSSNGSAV